MEVERAGGFEDAGVGPAALVSRMFEHCQSNDGNGKRSQGSALQIRARTSAVRTLASRTRVRI